MNYSFKSKRGLYLSNPLVPSLPLSPLKEFRNGLHKLNLDVSMLNTLIYTAVSVLPLALLCSAAARAISRGKGRLFEGVYAYFIIGIIIQAQALFLPIYTAGLHMGVINKRIGIILFSSQRIFHSEYSL